MTNQDYLAYRVELSRDEETGLIVAEIPALDIADDGADTDEALTNIKEMVAFHLECLVEEGEPIPPETSKGEGVYLHVKHPVRAA